MILRDYQQRIVTQTQEAWGSGVSGVMAQLATGGGKSVIISDLVQRNDGMSLLIAHRTELISQLSLTLAKFGMRHNIIAQRDTIREIAATHHIETGSGFYDPRGSVVVASVDTLVKLSSPWFRHVSLAVVDEAHHVLAANKWGRALSMFQNARTFLPTATPVRADGRGLGRHASGLADTIIFGPTMRQLITDGHLCDYRIYAPRTHIDLSRVKITASGDYSPAPLRAAVHESRITGDIVEHYLKIAPGKRGVTFTVDIQSAHDTAVAFRKAGVPAEVVSSLTPPLQRQKFMRQFRAGELLQLVNVDILGEGVDVPAIEVVSMGRPTQSYCTFAQQFGRGLRTSAGKQTAIIIDHVNNYAIHGLPDAPRNWSLDDRERKTRTTPDDVIPLKTCVHCLSVYSRMKRDCPFCGKYSPPAERSGPEFVDGDLLELAPETLAALRGEIDKPLKLPHGVADYVIRGIKNRHSEKILAQTELRDAIAQWAGIYKHAGETDSDIYRRFYITFGIDVLSAQALAVNDAKLLCSRIIDNGGNK